MIECKKFITKRTSLVTNICVLQSEKTSRGHMQIKFRSINKNWKLQCRCCRCNKTYIQTLSKKKKKLYINHLVSNDKAETQEVNNSNSRINSWRIILAYSNSHQLDKLRVWLIITVRSINSSLERNRNLISISST